MRVGGQRGIVDGQMRAERFADVSLSIIGNYRVPK